MFRIRLHIEDIGVLQKVRNFLGVGRVEVDVSNCLFIISDVKSLLIVLFPLLAKYHLYTSKWLDYLDFKTVILFLSKYNTIIYVTIRKDKRYYVSNGFKS